MAQFQRIGRSHANTGFTLIELLVVIAIIGLLSSIVLASLTAARERAQDARQLSDLRQMELALALYRNANGRYPAPPTGYKVEGLRAVLVPQYIGDIPQSPNIPSGYGYYSDSRGSDYIITANVKDVGCKVGTGTAPWTTWNDRPFCGR